MKHAFAVGVILATVAAVLAAPIREDNRKPVAFPAGQYILTGGGEPGLGQDLFEFTKSFRLLPGQYVLSGGPKPTDLIVVDDDLEVWQDKVSLFIDDDGRSTTALRGKEAARYQGQPIVLVLDATKKLRIRGIDYQATDAVLGPLWLHRWDGARKQLTEGKSAVSAATLPAAFYDESFSLADGFEMPKGLTTDAALDLPEQPAKLLPRFKSAPKP